MDEIKAKSLLNKQKKGDDWFLGDYTLNPYVGCSMGCIYCYTRGSKYGGDHGVNVSAKFNAVPILKKQLKNIIRKDKRGFIVLGSAADPYPTVEKDLKLTREILGMIKRYKFPLHICTKSTMILRDMDILKGIKEDAILPCKLEGRLESGLIVSFSFSTLDKEISSILEPGAPSPMERLETMKKCSEAGFKTGILNMPILPYISDSEEDLEAMVCTAKNYGAHYVMSAGLTLFGEDPDDCRTLYYKFLKEHYPEMVSEYLKLFRGTVSPSKRYQMDLSRKLDELSRRYGIKHRII